MSHAPEEPPPDPAGAEPSASDRAKPPPDASWLVTEEIRGSGFEEAPIPLNRPPDPRSGDIGPVE
ncbi:hypothetical protein Afil01_44700 [Actinorhabdospora filicis]|uniref:Uncharacterized protein n=1 Tax=Actinorhabdospora filicis TaxID=1785913 RepID=A0A9W6SPC4_9ACTN|nr:hypothetical protein Afil01_44700 [Actinorhabdospora filicis]